MEVDPDGLQEIEEVLKDAALRNEIVEFARTSGSDAGKGVKYLVYGFDCDTREVHVKRCDSTAHPLAPPSHYRSKYIVWIKSPNGNLITNKLTAKAYSDVSLKRASRDADLRDVQATVQTASGLDTRTTKESNARSRLPFLYSRGTGQPADTQVLINDPGNEYAVRKSLQFLQEHGEWRIYAVIDAFVIACMDWPAWDRHYAELRSEGDQLRGRIPRLRERLVGSSTKDEADLHENYSAQRKLYDRSVLRPPEYERDGLAADRVRLFELQQLDYTPIFKVAQIVTPRGIRIYLKHTRFFGRLMSLGDSELAAHDVEKLVKSGLAFYAHEAPISFVLNYLSISELRAPIKRLKLNAPMRSRQLCIDYYSGNMTPILESILRDTDYLKNKLALFPPAEWSWEDLLDFHSSFVEMVQELVRWANHERGCIKL